MLSTSLSAASRYRRLAVDGESEQRFGFALHLGRGHRSKCEAIAQALAHCIGDQNVRALFAREALDARSDVDGVADHRELEQLFAADDTRHGHASVNSDAERKPRQP